MEFKEFSETVKVTISGLLGPEKEVALRENLKNNDTLMTGIIIKNRGDSVSLTLYIDESYGEYLEGKSIEEISEDILIQYATIPVPDFTADSNILIYKENKSKIMYRLVGKEGNEQFLKEHPHRDFLDMSIVYYVLIDESIHGCSSVLIRNEHMKTWGVDEGELYKQACKHTVLKFPPEIITIESLVNECFDEEGEKLEDSDLIYVLSNQRKHYGASCLLYDGILEYIEEKLGGNCYIIASSVHELLIVPECESDIHNDLLEGVRSGNELYLSKEEYLNNTMYYYQSGGELKIYKN